MKHENLVLSKKLIKVKIFRGGNSTRFMNLFDKTRF